MEDTAAGGTLLRVCLRLWESYEPAQERPAARANSTKIYAPGDEYLLYVGCLGSYDENGQKMARNLADVLDAAGVSLTLAEYIDNKVSQSAAVAPFVVVPG